jgi:hypothetical protein
MTYHYKALGLAAAVAFAPMAASAATVTIDIQSYGAIGNLSNNGNDPDIAQALAARDTFMGGTSGDIFSEGFDAPAPGEFTPCTGSNVGTCSSTAGGLDTNVGTFNVAGDQGTGNTVAPVNEAVIKSAGAGADIMGRYNVDADSDNNHIGGKWLDSNDWETVEWSIPGASGLTNIDRIAFFLTDVNDSGNVTFNVSVDGTDLTPDTDSITDDQPNGRLNLVTMSFEEAVTGNILISMTNASGDRSDGFGIDTIQVGGDLNPDDISAVPLPASALLLLGGLGGLGGLSALRRRKRTA